MTIEEFKNVVIQEWHEGPNFEMLHSFLVYLHDTGKEKLFSYKVCQTPSFLEVYIDDTGNRIEFPLNVETRKMRTEFLNPDDFSVNKLIELYDLLIDEMNEHERGSLITFYNLQFTPQLFSTPEPHSFRAVMVRCTITRQDSPIKNQILHDTTTLNRLIESWKPNHSYLLDYNKPKYNYESFDIL